MDGKQPRKQHQKRWEWQKASHKRNWHIESTFQKATVSAYENGSRLPSYDVLIKLARLFHVTTDNLLGVNDKQMIEVTGLTPRQQNTVWEIIEAYRAFNKANRIEINWYFFWGANLVCYFSMKKAQKCTKKMLPAIVIPIFMHANIYDLSTKNTERKLSLPYSYNVPYATRHTLQSSV